MSCSSGQQQNEAEAEQQELQQQQQNANKEQQQLQNPVKKEMTPQKMSTIKRLLSMLDAKTPSRLMS